MPNSSSTPEEAARGRLSLHPPGLFPLLLSRLFDHEVLALGPWVQAIEPDRDADFWRSMRQRELTLPRVFVAAQRAFGRSSFRFDSYKSSFSFPVVLSATRTGTQLRYLLVLQDFRGSLGTAFYRFSGKREPQGRYHPPVDDELSRHDINLVSDTLIELLYLAGEMEARKVSGFHLTVPSEFVVYGCHSGRLFETRLENAEDYQNAVVRISQDLAEAEQHEELDRVSRLLQAAIGETRHRARK